MCTLPGPAQQRVGDDSLKLAVEQGIVFFAGQDSVF
jgi:hypothetical protein